MTPDAAEARLAETIKQLTELSRQGAQNLLQAKLVEVVANDDPDELLFWATVFLVWRDGALTAGTRYLNVSRAMRAPHIEAN